MGYNDYETVIGLEIHAQLKTESKLFCSCPTEFSSGDNQNICPVCTGMPGALPVINKKALEFAVKVGKALNSEIDQSSVFARKNYFYPDMPMGYQISQYDRPICQGGFLEFYLNGKKKKVEIERAHLEADAGKSIHQGSGSLINLNRSSVPLLEIVSAPQMHSPEEAAEYARVMRQMLRYLEVCDGNLEEGSLRCDCNVSVRKKDETKLGTKVELKNINSFRFVEKALAYEVERQIDSIESGQKIVQETRLYDVDKNRTFTMRLKENAEDYRYFPEPDLMSITISDKERHVWEESVDEMPVEKVDRFQQEHGLSLEESLSLTQEKKLAAFFEEAVRFSVDKKSIVHWMMGTWTKFLNDEKLQIKESKISAQFLGEIVEMIRQGEISGTMGKKVFTEVWQTDLSPQKVVDKLGLKQISDINQIRKEAEKILENSPEQVVQFNSGKDKIFSFFVGQMMKVFKGQANPQIVNDVLREGLKQREKAKEE